MNSDNYHKEQKKIHTIFHLYLGAWKRILKTTRLESNNIYSSQILKLNTGEPILEGSQSPSFQDQTPTEQPEKDLILLQCLYFALGIIYFITAIIFILVQVFSA